MAIFLFALQLLFRFIFRLPVKAALAVMYATARLVCVIAARTPVKAMVKKNIETILRRADAEQLAEKLLDNFSRSILELLCLPFFDRRHFQQITRINGLEYLPKDKGAILLTMHIGNYELSHAALSNLGYKLALVLRAEKDPLFALVNRSRGSHGARMINVLEDDMYQESLKALDLNELVLILGDTGALESRHELLDFLGHQVPVATGWLTLAQRTGCSVVPILAHREKGVNIFTIFPPAIVTKDNRQEVLHNFVKVSEEFIRQHPEEWGMFLNEYETNRMVSGK